MERKDKLLKTELINIREFCYNNLSEFYIRNHRELDMAKTTFYKAMEGELLSESYISRIRNCYLNYAGSYRSVSKIKELVELIEKFKVTQQMSDWLAVVDFVNRYKSELYGV